MSLLLWIVNCWVDTVYLLHNVIKVKVKVNVQQSLYRSGEVLSVPGGWGSQISRQWPHEGGKVSPTHRPPLPPRKYSRYLFLLETESTPGATVWPEGLCQWKIPMTPSGIEPATFWFVAQYLSQLHHCVHSYDSRKNHNKHGTEMA